VAAGRAHEPAQVALQVFEPCTTPTISMIAVSWRERWPKSVLIASSMVLRRAISAALNRARSLRRAAREGAPSRR